MVTAISDIRIVPIGEDLTKEDLSLSILRGLEKCYRADKKIATGAFFTKGEWAVLDSEGKASRPTTTAVGQTYLVFSGTDRFDARATGQVTLIMSHPIIVKSSLYDTGEDYAVGDYLTVKDLTHGEAFVTKWNSGEPKLARVIEDGNGYLVYETLGGVE